MRVGQKSGVKKCTLCLRKKEEAIADHLKKLTPCDNPECPFATEIDNAIKEELQKPKFTFGEKIKKTIKFGPIKKSK